MSQDSIILIITAIIASQGIWTIVGARIGSKSSRIDLLKGLAHDRIIHVGRNYIKRGWISYDEYEDFMVYLYEPYAKLGGNGLAEKVIEDVKKLPIVVNTPTSTAYEDDNECG